MGLTMDFIVLARKERGEGKRSCSRRTSRTRVISIRSSIVSGPARRTPRSPNTSGKSRQGDYNDAYMINWESNVFPGFSGAHATGHASLPAAGDGRGSSRSRSAGLSVSPPTTRRTRALLPGAATERNGKRIACVGAGRRRSTVARDLAPLGYEVVVFDRRRAPAA